MDHTPASRSSVAASASERGFTLVELMVVVAIIALLAAIVIPNYVHARAQAAASQSQATMNEIATALELYHTDNQAYPASGPVTPALFGGATNPYMTSTPYNALGRAQYNYTFTAAAAGKPDTYVIQDPGQYDPTTISGLPNGAGGAAQCGTACHFINYDPQDGLYGTP